MASAWSAVSSNGKLLAKAWYSCSSHGSCGPALRLALRVQVQQFGGHVADLVGGALARLGPLIGAELVQRRAFGRGAGVARDQVQLLHGHVQLVAARVFEHHELAVLSGDLHDLQADVAADAVFFVHHRRARPERREVAQDRLRIGLRRAGGGAPGARAGRTAALRRAPRSGGVTMLRPGHLGRDGQREARVAVDELVPARDRPAASAPCARSISSSTSRRPAESAASSTRPANVVEEVRQRRERRSRRAGPRAIPAARRSGSCSPGRPPRSGRS